MEIRVDEDKRARAQAELKEVEQTIAELVVEVGKIVAGEYTRYCFKALGEKDPPLILLARDLTELLERRNGLRLELRAAELLLQGRPAEARVVGERPYFWVDGICIDVALHEWRHYTSPPPSMAYIPRRGWHTAQGVLYVGDRR